MALRGPSAPPPRPLKKVRSPLADASSPVKPGIPYCLNGLLRPHKIPVAILPLKIVLRSPQLATGMRADRQENSVGFSSYN